MKKIVVVWMLLGLIFLSACSSEDMWGPDGWNPNEGQYEYVEGETYAEIVENEFIRTSDMPVSTFSTDVDTASYSNVRRMLQDGYLPEPNAVRIEEMINYFTYNLPKPTGDEVINIYTEYANAPWNQNHKLLMIGLTAKEVEFEESDGMNLVFLIDVSGSMFSNDKLPLLKQAMKLLVDQLRPKDRISLVVYAGAAGVVLEGGDSSNKREIINALDDLQAGGSTAGGAGIELAYKVAQRNYIEGGNNRILIATDGDFNVGMSSTDELIELISKKKESGVFLSVLGFGTGNIRDDIMESLADNGNGVYYYIDSMKEAEKVFLHGLGATMITVAKDVKLQIEFNPMHVKGYRLIGYENRVLSNEDFNNDEKDAGDMGSGHVVIAFYELILADSDEVIEEKEFELPGDLKYDGDNYSEELMSIAIRYKHPEEDTSQLIESHTLIESFTESPSESFRFASSLVEFGLLLRGSKYKYNANYVSLLERAEKALGDDAEGYREEFLSLVSIAQGLTD